MALYEYICKSCNALEVVIRGINDNEKVINCKTCDLPLNRVYSSVGVSFKGSGFYSKDK